MLHKLFALAALAGALTLAAPAPRAADLPCMLETDIVAAAAGQKGETLIIDGRAEIGRARAFLLEQDRTVPRDTTSILFVAYSGINLVELYFVNDGLACGPMRTSQQGGFLFWAAVNPHLGDPA